MWFWASCLTFSRLGWEGCSKLKIMASVGIWDDEGRSSAWKMILVTGPRAKADSDEMTSWPNSVRLQARESLMSAEAEEWRKPWGRMVTRLNFAIDTSGQ